MKALHKLIQHKDKQLMIDDSLLRCQFDARYRSQDRTPYLASCRETYLSNTAYIKQITALGAEVLTYR